MTGIDQAPYSDYIQKLRNSLAVNTEVRFAAQQYLNYTQPHLVGMILLF